MVILNKVILVLIIALVGWKMFKPDPTLHDVAFLAGLLVLEYLWKELLKVKKEENEGE